MVIILRSKNIVVVCHCVLNQNSVVCPLARARGAFTFVKQLVDEGVGIIQLPCPEFKYLGITRKPMNKDEYDNVKYRQLCKSISLQSIEELFEYINNGYLIKGVIGINKSPTCSITKETGVFMEEFFALLKEKNLYLNYTEVPVDFDNKKDSESFYSKLKFDLKL